MADEQIVDAPPDWDTLAEEIRCPMCDYNLRGLIEPRCPECGFRFEWPALLDPTRRAHPYVFEHHPERNVRSFIQTLLGGLRPTKFWTSLHPAQPSRPKRLTAYVCVTIALLVMTVFSVFVPLTISDLQSTAQFRRRLQVSAKRYPERLDWAVSRYGSLKNYLDIIAPTGINQPMLRRMLDETIGGPQRKLLIVCLIFPIATFAAMMIFQISMSRAKVSPRHVLRCVVYSFDSVVWIGMVSLVYASVTLAGGNMPNPGAALGDAMIIVGPIGGLFFAYRLYVAYRCYLRFDRPFATVLATQVIAFLASLRIATALFMGV